MLKLLYLWFNMLFSKRYIDSKLLCHGLFCLFSSILCFFAFKVVEKKKKRQRRQDDDDEEEEDADDPDAEASEEEEPVQPAKRQRRGTQKEVNHLDLLILNPLCFCFFFFSFPPPIPALALSFTHKHTIFFILK